MEAAENEWYYPTGIRAKVRHRVALSVGCSRQDNGNDLAVSERSPGATVLQRMAQT